MSALSSTRSHFRLTGTMRQLFGVVSRRIMEAVALEVGADRYYKRFFAVEHLRLAMGFVLQGMHSLRELAAAIVPGGRLAPKGAEAAVVGRSQLCDAFRNRKWEFFAGVYGRVAAGIQARVRGRGDPKRADVRAIDGTILELIHKLIATFPGFRSEASAKLTLRLNVGNLLPESLVVTPGRRSDHRCIDPVIEWGRKGLTYLFDRGYFKLSFFQKLQDSGNFFITRWKDSCPGHVVEVLKEYTGRTWSGFRLHQDLLVELGEDEKSAYPGRLRAVLAFDEKGQLWTLLTNRLDLTALEVCLLYRDRWAIETFWRTLKRSLDLRELKVANANALMILTLTSLIAYCLAQAAVLLQRAKLTLAEAIHALRNLDTMIADEFNRLWLGDAAPPPLLNTGRPGVMSALEILVALEA